jgi:hypothetical protein
MKIFSNLHAKLQYTKHDRLLPWLGTSIKIKKKAKLVL